MVIVIIERFSFLKFVNTYVIMIIAIYASRHIKVDVKRPSFNQ